MIHYFKIKNYLSIKDEVVLSFEATRERTHRDFYVKKQCGINLLRMGAIYGANASGKTNILNAINFVRSFVLQKPNDKNSGTQVVSFVMNDEPTEFELSFITNDKRYLLRLKIDKDKILEESLQVYISQKPSLLYKRVFKNGLSDIIFNSSINFNDAIENEIRAKCLQNMTVLSAYSQVNASCKYFENVLDYFTKIVQNPIYTNTSLSNFTKRRLYNNSDLINKVITRLKYADFNIENVNINTKGLPEEVIDDFVKSQGLLSQEDKHILTEHLQKEKLYEANFTHFAIEEKNKKEFNLSEKLESLGTIRMLGLATVLDMMTLKDSFITIDEIENSMHPKLIEHLISEFLNMDTESQILFTTHYDGLLDEKDIIRKDTIWFTNKREDASTELYSLSDFKDVKPTISLRKAYRNGYFYAQPNI